VSRVRARQAAAGRALRFILLVQRALPWRVTASRAALDLTRSRRLRHGARTTRRDRRGENGRDLENGERECPRCEMTPEGAHGIEPSMAETYDARKFLRSP